MGAVAKSMLDHGGSVTGIIPDFLKARENSLTRVQEMIVTPDMHERKRLMFERSDAFVALPGGVGTLEELVEQMTWQQLGRHIEAGAAREHRRFLGAAAGAADAYARHRIHPPDPATSRFSRPNGSRISCRGCAPPPPARLQAPRNMVPEVARRL